MQNVVLIGFMGTGKTAVGRIVARMLNYHFVDTDEMVEEATGLTINQIFRKHGEIRFRSEEALVVKKLKGKKNLVIATGGGVALSEENVKILREEGIIVLLTADPAVILERVSRRNTRRNTRPFLAKGKTIETINELIRERREIYENFADLTVDTSGSSMEDTAARIVKMIRKKAHEKS